MADQKTDSPDSLPPTLCTWCKHGTVIKEARVAYSEDDGEFWLEDRRAHRRELSFCRNPLMAGKGEPPLEMENVILHCQGFEQRPLEVTKGCPEKAALRKKAPRGRRRRRGP